MLKRIVCLVILCSLVIGVVNPINLLAVSSSEVLSGKCGDNLTWEFSDGWLTISGSGDMYDYSSGNATPWRLQLKQGRVVGIHVNYGVTSIGNYAFSPYMMERDALFAIEIYLPDTITRIGECAFSHNSEIISIDIPSSVTSIGMGAFLRCRNLEYISIPNSVNTIEKWAFHSCVNLRTVDYSGTKYEWNCILDSSNISHLVNTDINYGHYVPVESVYIRNTGYFAFRPTYMSVEITPSNATNKKVKWSVDNPYVATIDDNGLLIPKQNGIVKVTAEMEDGNCTYSRNFEISDICGDYDPYAYNFRNSSGSFGYEHSKSNPYHFPPERYMQIGKSESKAKKLSEEEAWGGNCFGMSMSSILFFKGVMHEERYPTSLGSVCTVDGFPAPNNQHDKLTQMIELLQLSWELKPKCHRLSLKDVANELDKGNPVCLVIDGVSQKYGKGAHAVVIYNYTIDVNGVYIFDIYDCSKFITHLIYVSENAYDFIYSNDEYKWTIRGYISFDELKKLYNKLYNKNHNGAASLLSVEEEPPYTYIITPSTDLTITNSSGQTSTIIDGELSGEIEDIDLILPSYLSTDPKYTIIAPTDTYTITGTGDEIITTSLADDYMSVEVTHKASAPITISADLYDIKVENSGESDYLIKYTTFDNIFDEMTLSGTTSGIVNTLLDSAKVSISGATNIDASVTVSGEEVCSSATDLNGSIAVVECAQTESGASLMIYSNDEALTDEVSIPRRLKAAIPMHSLESGEYSSGQILEFTNDDDETIIYYTTDGTEPTKETGKIYTLPIEISRSVTIKAMATKYGYENSDTIELNYTLPTVGVPLADIPEGEYDSIQTVELLHENGVEIYYTTDESDPEENGFLYTTPITIYDDTVINAYAVKDGVASEVVAYSYEINHAKPLYLTDTIINQDGEVIDGENMTSLSKITLVTRKTTDEDVNGTVIAAFYNEDGELAGLAMDEFVFAEQSNVIELETSAFPDAKSLKISVWNNVDDCKPLCVSKKIK